MVTCVLLDCMPRATTPLEPARICCLQSKYQLPFKQVPNPNHQIKFHPLRQFLPHPGQDPALATVAAPAPEHHKLGISAVLLTSVPFGLAALASLALAHHSDHKRERVLHLAIPFMIAGLLLAAFPAMVRFSTPVVVVCDCCGVSSVDVPFLPFSCILFTA